MKIKSFFVILLVSLFLINSSTAFSSSTKQNQSIILANRHAKMAHDAYERKDFLKAGQYYEKAYQANKVNVYLDNSVVAYTSYASELANNKDYDNAVKFCNKALSMSLDDKNAKELLSDIYFSKGTDFFYTGNLEKAKIEIENSLKYSVLKDQTDRAKDALSKIQTAIEKGLAPAPKYEESSDDSITNTLALMESRLYGSSSGSLPLLERVNNLEKSSFGKIYNSDSLIVRVDRLKRTISPDLTSHRENNAAANTSQVYEDSYVHDIIEQSGGKVNIFGKMPITVYIDDNKVKSYRKFYKDATIEGFKEWEKASEGLIKFKFIEEPAKADIQVVWQEDFEDFPWQPKLEKEDISAEKERMKYRKANAAVQIGSVAAMLAGSLIGLPVIGGVGALGSSFASPILQYKGMKINKLSPAIKINTKITEGMADEQAGLKIKQTAMHQMGHAIGIYGHSHDSNDIMYNDFSVSQLSEKDANTIREIYKSLKASKH